MPEVNKISLNLAESNAIRKTMAICEAVAAKMPVEDKDDYMSTSRLLAELFGEYLKPIPTPRTYRKRT
jgi:hypothetical protein